LVGSRNSGFGVESLKISEINAYCDLIGVDDPEERKMILHRVRIIDDEWVKYYQKKDKQG
jgi:hypothetical protein